jgi:hypothetical protein
MVDNIIQLVTKKLSTMFCIEGIVLGGFTCKRYSYRGF